MRKCMKACVRIGECEGQDMRGYEGGGSERGGIEIAGAQ